ncbi:hypothetical protein [Cryobacterium sp. PAMC25264]|uniref:hypothetical protein n=1 Tax=Cryobacterium sp. PAMC25264 TaxID=2861288 RepID=UPI001C6349C2|nr:hypothetical protein [Cryobacterium sp. PAMC25264]QYF74679.1 hypothetical protein KY500_05770 [Cryobacterium sp. PAMC25264]
MRERVRAEHGRDARIVRAEQITVGGIRGYFAKRHVEVTVEVPVEVFVEVPSAGRRRGRDELTTRLGIAALLDDADAAESELIGIGTGPDRAGAGATGAGSAGAGTSGAGSAGSGPAGSGANGVGSTGVGHGAAGATGAGGADAASSGAAQPGETESPVDVDPAGQAAPRRAASARERRPEAVSTGTPDFARLMDDLTFATSPGRGGPGQTAPKVASGPGTGSGTASSGIEAPELPLELSVAAPALLAGPGDLVLLVGIPDDVLEVVRLLSTAPGAPIFAASDRIIDRRGALAARARGVEQGRSIMVACPAPGPFALSGPGGATGASGADVAALAALGADQAWAVVHAGRKAADTARWVSAARATLDIDALAVVGAESTATPGTVRRLGLPIGWIAPAQRSPSGPVGTQQQARTPVQERPGTPADSRLQHGPEGPNDPFAIG